MCKPIIGILPQYDREKGRIFVAEQYIHAVTENNATAWILPQELTIQEIKELHLYFDGFLFTGGPDTDARYFGEMTHASSKYILPKRDTLEIALLKHLLTMQSPIPVLGICRGIQVMNIAAGGNIYQDIDTFVETKHLLHMQTEEGSVCTHTVSINFEKGKYEALSTLVQKNFKVNSFHHQAVRRIAPCFHAFAISEDGLTEGIYHTEAPYFIGVQWHPELLYKQMPEHALLFQSFVNAARQEKRRKSLQKGKII